MADGEQPWKQEIRDKLLTTLEGKEEEWLRITWYLDEEDREYKHLSEIPPAWRTLKSTLKSEKAFKMYAVKLAEDTKRAEKDASFRQVMNSIYSEMMEASESPVDESDFQEFDMVRFQDCSLSGVAGFGGLARSWSLIPARSQAEILQLIPKIITNSQMLRAIDDVVSLVNTAGGTVVMVALAAVSLSYEAIKNIRRWWNGEISGKRCVKNIVDASFSVAAGVGGGFGGAALGSFAGPLGTLAGGMIGGFLTAHAAGLLCDRMTQFLFGIPKNEALENAYNFLGVKMSASNNEINSAFRKLCLKTHPDKGGDKEEFFKVQLSLATIKMSRGEM